MRCEVNIFNSMSIGISNLIAIALLLAYSPYAYCAQSVATDATTESNSESWRDLISKAKTLEHNEKYREAEDVYAKALANLPSSASDQDRALVLHLLGLASQNREQSIQRLIESVNLYERSNSSSEDYVETLRLLGVQLGREKRYMEKQYYLAKALVLRDKVIGKHLRYALCLVDYSTASAQAHDMDKSNKAIREAMRIANSETSLTEKREHLVQLLSNAAEYYFQQRGDVATADKLYKRAVYEGESLWFPLYGWSMNAMYEHMQMLRKAGREREAKSLEQRLQIIGTTGNDPKGKDVCKFWNGEDAPPGTPSAGIPSTPGFAGSLITRSPLEIYQKPKQIKK